jgi:general secretion pathway protein D
VGRGGRSGGLRGLAWAISYALVLAWATAAGAQQTPGAAPGLVAENDLVQLDFNDVELSVVIDTIARLTGKNFIYDDRVRGRVTIVSPTKVPIDEAYKVFESVLQVKGFTTVTGPGNAIRVIPVRDAKETSIETIHGLERTPVSDRFVTRLIPLRYSDAEAITNTLKPLVSSNASMVAYPPTNTVILTDAATNISRILSILRSIDVETHKEELSVIKIRHADASVLAQQLSEIFGAETGTVGDPRPVARARRVAQAAVAAAEVASKGMVRVLTDARTNSLIVLASRQRTTELRDVIQRLDVPVVGGGRIHVYYLKHADSEELSATLNALISGQPATPAATPATGQQAGTVQALRAAISELAEGVSVTADAATNSLVIQASQEGYATISQVIAALDIPRPQVLVEALIMEIAVSDNQELGFNGLARIFRGNTDYTIGSLTNAAGRSVALGQPLRREFGGAGGEGEAATGGTIGDTIGGLTDGALANLLAAASRNTLDFARVFNPETGQMETTNEIVGGSLIQGIIRASATVGGTNILSAPHILTMDNEEAEIKVGANIPIVTSRVQSAAGIDATGSLATSQNIERQDIGITLRVTPQISEGNNLRLRIFQEITEIDDARSRQTGDPQEVGVSLTNRTVENTVVVADEETVVIGGLISENYGDTVNKVPWLGDIPILGWLFKSTSRTQLKTNLIIFLTPHIVRTAQELERETIRKREEFWNESDKALDLSEREQKEQEKRHAAARAAGLDPDPYPGRNPVRGRLLQHSERYPVERMREIEQEEERARQEAEAAAIRAADAPQYGILAATFRDEGAAAATLQQLVDAGHDGTLVSGDSAGSVLFEVRLGPYETLEEADRTASVVAESFGLSPTVTVYKEKP